MCARIAHSFASPDTLAPTHSTHLLGRDTTGLIDENNGDRETSAAGGNGGWEVVFVSPIDLPRDLQLSHQPSPE